jgi:hypothetical protein
MGKDDVSRLMAVKAALVGTTNTAGWQYVKQIAANVVKQAVQAAIDENDEVQGAILRRKAKAAQDVFRELFNAIEVSKQFGTDQEPEWFEQLSFEETEIQ